MIFIVYSFKIIILLEYCDSEKISLPFAPTLPGRRGAERSPARHTNTSLSGFRTDGVRAVYQWRSDNVRSPFEGGGFGRL